MSYELGKQWNWGNNLNRIEITFEFFKMVYRFFIWPSKLAWIASEEPLAKRLHSLAKLSKVTLEQIWQLYEQIHESSETVPKRVNELSQVKRFFFRSAKCSMDAISRKTPTCSACLCKHILIVFSWLNFEYVWYLSRYVSPNFIDLLLQISQNEVLKAEEFVAFLKFGSIRHEAKRWFFDINFRRKHRFVEFWVVKCCVHDNSLPFTN